MTTPSFVTQGNESLTEVRFFTPLDVYHYTVDNRPLQDLNTNISVIATGGVDSARRSGVLTQLAMSDVFRHLFKVSGNAQFITGLEVEYFGTNYIRINAGGVYSNKDINSSNTAKIIKQGLLVTPQTLNFVKPTASDTSIVYVVAGRYKDLVQNTMASSTLPYLDNSNPFLPCLLLNGELEVKLIAGTAANSGSEVAPIVEAGWFPIYEVVSSYAAAAPTIRISSSAPAIKGSRHSVLMSDGGTDPATAINLNGILTPHFPKTSTSNLNLKLSLSSNGVNPYAPIKLRVLYSGSAANGNFAMRSRVGTYAVGSVVSGTPGSISNVEVLPCELGLVDELKAFETVIMRLSPSLFAGFVNNAWVVNRDFLNLTLQRDVASSLDTNTGNLFVHEVVAFQ